MSAEVGSRAFVIRGAALSFVALTFVSCAVDNLGGGSPPGVDAGSGPVDARSGPVAAVTLGLSAFGGPSETVTAGIFVNEPGVGEKATCAAPMSAGACQLTACHYGPPVVFPTPGYGNFGPISATVGTTTETLGYTGSGYPTVQFPGSITLGTGDIMTFQGGDGVSVPVFDVPVTIPGLAVLTSPEMGGSDTAFIDSSQDLTVTWVPISIGQIDFEITGDSLPGGVSTVLTVLCTYDGASGSGVVPQTLLSALRTMTPTTFNGSLSSELQTTTVVNGLTIVTTSSQVDPTAIRTFTVTLQ